MYKYMLFCGVMLATLLSCTAVEPQAGLVNKKVNRVIDLSSQLVKVTYRILVENVGSSEVGHYKMVFDAEHTKHLSWIAASTEKPRTQVLVTRVPAKDGTADHWLVELSPPLKPGQVSPVLEVQAVFTKLIQPYPTEISQGERQLVVYNENHYYYSVYETKQQTTKVKLPMSGTVESFSELKPSQQIDRTISYGPYDKVEPLAVSPMKIHCENNSPFLTVSTLNRKIQVSHWGGVVSVEESVDIHHTGAKLKDSFSRYDYQREPTSGISSVKSFKTKLHPQSYDIYYRDDIGNISTSNVRKTTKNVLVDLRPRFPLFGGWKTHYVLGYTVPASEYLKNDGSRYLLRIPFIDHLYDNSVVDEAIIKISLPEGAHDMRLRLPFTATREQDQLMYSYLDVIGRPVVTLRKDNLVENHISYLELEYQYNSMYMLQEPLLIVTAIFIICLIAIIYNK